MPRLGPRTVDNVKAGVLRDLCTARDEGRLDPDIGPLLDLINSREGLVTTSSCSGRLQLIEVTLVGDKQGALVLGKWHSRVDPMEVLARTRSPGSDGQVILMLQPLLLHIRCLDLFRAVQVWQLGQRAGLKFSTIRSVKLGPDGSPAPWGMVVELLGTERMEVPLHFLNEAELERLIPFWTEHANSLLSRTKGRMKALMDLLSDPTGPAIDLAMGDGHRPEG